ncbi:MAG TPA: hypothetical protein VKA18_16040 [Alphaproteobacteria bacterium]|nr:hypothetical protein [Alphaproteobacteria bacterium]
MTNSAAVAKTLIIIAAFTTLLRRWPWPFFDRALRPVNNQQLVGLTDKYEISVCTQKTQKIRPTDEDYFTKIDNAEFDIFAGENTILSHHET